MQDPVYAQIDTNSLGPVQDVRPEAPRTAPDVQTTAPSCPAGASHTSRSSPPDSICLRALACELPGHGGVASTPSMGVQTFDALKGCAGASRAWVRQGLKATE